MTMTDKDQINTGGAAFPFEGGKNNHIEPSMGVTLRDYFAAHAEGFSDQVTAEFASEATGLNVPESHEGYEVALFWAKADAIYKYMQADAMIAAREVSKMTNKTHIPDEAVQAASQAYCNHYDAYDNHNDAVKEALTAALPHLSAPCAVEVKKLEWQEPTKETNGCWTAKSPIGTYSVVNENGWYAVLDEHAWGVDGFEWSSTDLSKDKRQTAFAAAQADFERRILSCVVAKPVDVAAVWNEAVERSAVLADSCVHLTPDVGNAVRNLKKRALSPAEPAQHPDDAAVDSFTRLMKSKLAQKRKEGRSGWQGMSADELTDILRQHVDKGDPVDVANLCMMLSENGQSISPAEPAQCKTCSGKGFVGGVIALGQGEVDAMCEDCPDCTAAEPAQGEKWQVLQEVLRPITNIELRKPEEVQAIIYYRVKALSAAPNSEAGK